MTTSMAAPQDDRITQFGRGLGTCSSDSLDALLDAAQVADLYGVHVISLRATQRGPKAFRLVGTVFYRRGDVEEWAERGGIVPRTKPVRADGPVECAPWCRYGDGHATELFRDDQRCETEALRIELSAG
jgi:hypothetical protein